MALQAALPPTDSGEFRRSALLKRLAASRARAEQRRPVEAVHRTRGWDPAVFLGVSPPVMLTLSAQVGVALGLLVYSTFQIASRAEPAASPPQAAALEPGSAAQVEAELFVTVAELPAAAEVVDDYYFYLRQGMFVQAWDLTDEEFRLANYSAGFEAYQQSWAGAQAMEILSLDLVWQDTSEAHIFGEIQEGGSGRRWRNSYVLRFDEPSSSWKIHAITPAG